MSHPLSARGRLSLGAVALVALALVVGACGSSSSSTSTSSGSTGAATAAGSSTGDATASASTGAGRPKTLYFINPFDANPWAKKFAETYMPLLEQGGIKVTRLQNGFDPVKEAQQFDQAISQKPGAIAVFAADGKAVVPSIKRAEAAGIPVFNLTADIDPAAKSGLVSNIVSNAAQLGQISGKLLVEGLEKAGFDKANILVLSGVATQSVVVQELAALREELAKTPQYKIVSTQDTQWDQTKAESLASQVFASYANKGGIQGVMGSNDSNAAGAIQAAQKLGLKVGGKGGLVVVGATCFPVGFQNINAGLQYGTASEGPADEAKESAKLTLKWFNGEQIPADVRLEEYEITKANIAEVGETCKY